MVISTLATVSCLSAIHKEVFPCCFLISVWQKNIPWSSYGGGNVNKNNFPGNTPVRGEKHLLNLLALWEGSSSSMEMGHNIKEEEKEASRRWSGKGTQRCIYL